MINKHSLTDQEGRQANCKSSPLFSPPNPIQQSHPQLGSRPPSEASLHSLPHSQRTEKILSECPASLLLCEAPPLPPARVHPKSQVAINRNTFSSESRSSFTYQDLRRISYQAAHSHHTPLIIREGKRNQKNTHPTKTRYQHLELKSSQTQMPKCQYKNKQKND